MRIPTLRVAWLVMFLLLITTATAYAKVPDPDDVVVGDWNVNIKCGKEFFSSVLFPPATLNHPLLASRPFGIRQKYSCRLSIFPNGTFALSPSHPSTRENVLLLRGRWQIQPNPYCVTDRFYDQLHLQSYPRRLVAIPTKEQSSLPFLWRKRRRSPTPLGQLPPTSLSLHCHIQGRYASSGLFSSNRNQRNTCRARMTHGFLVWKTTTSTTTEARSNKVGASFQGNRIFQRNAESPYQMEKDLEMFGY